MTRREIREHLFRMLFRKEFHDVDELTEQINFYFEEMEQPSESDYMYLKDKFNKILGRIDDIDAIIEKASEGWKLNRMGKIDLTILRLATYEICFDDDIPTKVAINEAIEIAKIFAEDKAPGFINGVLAKVAGDCE